MNVIGQFCSARGGIIPPAISPSIVFGSIPASLVRSLVNHATGFYYFEMVFGSAVDVTKVGVGIDNNVESLTTSGGQAGSILWTGDGAVAYNGGLNIYAASAFNVADIIGIAVDLTNKKIWFRVNGGNWNLNGSANPVTTVGGFSIAAVVPNAYAYAQLESGGDQVTANFSGPFTNTIPGGSFTNW